MRNAFLFRVSILFSASGCAVFGAGGDSNGNDGPGGPDGCVGLECSQVECEPGKTTSLSGVVMAPNGTLPLPNATVYVPNATVEPFAPGVACDRCGAELSGKPLVRTTTDTMGFFTLTNVPATRDVPVVVQIGRWRRQIVVADIPGCWQALKAQKKAKPARAAERAFRAAFSAADFELTRSGL